MADISWPRLIDFRKRTVHDRDPYQETRRRSGSPFIPRDRPRRERLKRSRTSSPARARGSACCGFNTGPLGGKNGKHIEDDEKFFMTMYADPVVVKAAVRRIVGYGSQARSRAESEDSGCRAVGLLRDGTSCQRRPRRGCEVTDVGL